MREQVISTVKEAIANNAYVSSDGEVLSLDSNDVDHIAEESADELILAGYINGADFVEWLREKGYGHLYHHNSQYMSGVGLVDVETALQEYLKGEN